MLDSKPLGEEHYGMVSISFMKKNIFAFCSNMCLLKDKCAECDIKKVREYLNDPGQDPKKIGVKEEVLNDESKE